jgi:hypothetical protein
MSKKRTPREALQSYAPGQGGPTTNTVDRYYEPSRRTPGALVDLLNRGQMPRGIELSPFAINRNRMLEDEARQEQLYRAQNMQPVELPERAPVPQASLAQILMNQYDPSTAPAASFMLRSLSAASPRGRARRADKQAEDAAFAMERDRIDNSEMPAEIGSPGYKGRLFDAFQYLVGRKRAM